MKRRRKPKRDGFFCVAGSLIFVAAAKCGIQRCFALSVLLPPYPALLSVERRLLLWFVTSTAFLLIYMTLNIWFVPPQPRPVIPPAGLAAEVPLADDALIDDGDVATIERDKTAIDDAAKGDKAEASTEDAIRRPAPTRITLGSMDPDSGFYLLATLNNRGGAVERIELTQRNENGRLKYRRVDTTSGYLGYLAASTSSKNDGVAVNIVGPGTPAAIAKSQSTDVADGLMTGDLIIAANAMAIQGPDQLDAMLEKTKPGDSMTLEVRRAKVQAEIADQFDETKAADEFETLKFVVKLTEHPLDLVRLAATGGVDEVVGNLSRLACRLTLSQLGTKSIPTGGTSIRGLEWIKQATYQHEITGDEAKTATFTLPLSANELKDTINSPLTIIRSYTVTPGSFVIDMDVAVRNDGDEPQQLAYRLDGANGLTLEGWWYSTKISPNWFGGASARDIVFKTQREGHNLISGYELLKLAKKKPQDPDQLIFAADEDESARALQYIGTDAQYFVVAYVPPADKPAFQGFRQAAATIVADANKIPVHKERAADVGFFVDSIVADVPAGALLRQPLRMFAGPKVPELIDPLGLGATNEYGLFGGVSKVLGWILHTLYSFIGNYAIAIVLLTILVRSLLFPVSRKAAIHAQRMQELAPELKKINDKFKDDMEGKLRAQREFQKKVGFNPLAGCLPAFLQLPIFIGLYRCLSVDIELRQANFSRGWQWASNLAGPDMLAYWGDWLMDYFSGRGTGWLGPYFNILPIAVVILFLVQQKMFMPPPTDEQQELTQKVMTVMTLMMALFFFRVPAGLCIYFITSSLWGIIERIVVKKTIPASKGFAFDGGVVDGTVVATKLERESFANRIKKQLNPEPPKALPVAKRKKPPGKK